MNSKFLSLNSLNPCIAPLTEKDEHLKREYIEVHALTLEPVACTCGFVARILLVVDSYEDDRVDNEGDEKHDHEHVAYADRAVRAAVRVHRERVVEQAHRRVHLFLYLSDDVRAVRDRYFYLQVVGR